jgi:hypothetical protein
MLRQCHSDNYYTIECVLMMGCWPSKKGLDSATVWPNNNCNEFRIYVTPKRTPVNKPAYNWFWCFSLMILTALHLYVNLTFRPTTKVFSMYERSYFRSKYSSTAVVFELGKVAFQVKFRIGQLNVVFFVAVGTKASWSNDLAPILPRNKGSWPPVVNLINILRE